MEFLKKKHPLRLKYYLLVDVETHHGTSLQIKTSDCWQTNPIRS